MITYEIIPCIGEDNVSRALNDKAAQGFTLHSINFAGQIEQPIKPSLVTGDPITTVIVHTRYLVVMERQGRALRST